MSRSTAVAIIMPSSSFIGTHIDALPSPAFVVDLAAVKGNCDAMLSRAAEAGIKLRGQTKTHKTIEGALLQTGGSKRYVMGSLFTSIHQERML